jgi:hypothetical protein
MMKRRPFVELDDAALDSIAGGKLLSIFSMGVDKALDAFRQASSDSPMPGFPRIDFVKRMDAEMRRDEETYGKLEPGETTVQDRINEAHDAFAPVHETTPQDRIDDAFDLVGTDGDTRSHVDEMPHKDVSEMMADDMRHDDIDSFVGEQSPQAHIDDGFSALDDPSPQAHIDDDFAALGGGNDAVSTDVDSNDF